MIAQRNLGSADMVEVSVALAEALLYHREGTALEKELNSYGSSDGSGVRNIVPSCARASHVDVVRGAVSASIRGTRTSLSPIVANEGNPVRENDEAVASTGRLKSNHAIVSGTPAMAELWDGTKASENARRMAILAASLEASEVYNLQVLRQSVERQLREMEALKVFPVRRGKGFNGTPSLADDEERWHEELLRARLEVITKAVENKGGWRAAVFLDTGEVNVEVDVKPWPPEEGLLMLQTVKDALLLQLAEVILNPRRSPRLRNSQIIERLPIE